MSRLTLAVCPEITPRSLQAFFGSENIIGLRGEVLEDLGGERGSLHIVPSETGKGSNTLKGQN
ncbi:hypothetical protein JCM14722_29770 [Pseudodesulfovibrio portus]|uniref:Uncharacterized protein n=1 Tax=Pseudodesulfovibrio portus TaxID=231439 RepID=A0ABM8AVY7_9BACT|nr:hypothetical protein JCM14722_29770 [Pseudodesulfovibrio portus]